ncbi:hypothetical protein AYK26_06900 [Euryarchaeota archaeon SM23-78]|nr:MAG: hypothetical protein AYK26_06900 [Euryarchaeota archaeon SM23-78]MBW3000391.1 hypothetical protein [Candidatus Woesearchaeota archaeon]
MNKKGMNKKGYMFTLDVTISIIILVIGVALIFYNFRTIRTVYFTEQLSEDIIGVMAYTTINDLCIDPANQAGICDCPNYINLTKIVCSGKLQDVNASLLSMISEIIETHAFGGDEVKDLIRETFVKKNIIDEKRYGFAILYTDLVTSIPLELYNTETYVP